MRFCRRSALDNRVQDRSPSVKRSRRGLSSEEPQTPTSDPSKTGNLQGKGASASKDKAVAKKKAADDKKRAGPYETQWMMSPLGDPQVQQDPMLALAAYKLIPEMIARFQSDQEILRKFLISQGLLKEDEEEDEEEDEDEDEEPENPFLAFV